MTKSPSKNAGKDAEIVKLTAERDEARHIVTEIHWMAKRYAEGRMTYAPSMFNDAIAKAVEAGWLESEANGDSTFAKEGSDIEGVKRA